VGRLRAAALLVVAAALLFAPARPARADRWVARYWDDFAYNQGWRVSLAGTSRYAYLFDPNQCPPPYYGPDHPGSADFGVPFGGAPTTLHLYQTDPAWFYGWNVYPIVTREDIFGGIPGGAGWALELRLRWVFPRGDSWWGGSTQFVPNAPDVFVGSGSWSELGTRPDGVDYRSCPVGYPYPPDWGNAFLIHTGATDPNGNPYGNWSVWAFGQNVFYGWAPFFNPYDTGWHTFRLEVFGSAWWLYIDGGLWGAGWGAFIPRIIGFGSWVETCCPGRWVETYVDYVKLTVYPTGSLSGPTNIGRAAGPAAFGVSAYDWMKNFSGWAGVDRIELYRSPTAYQSWTLVGTVYCYGAGSCSGTVYYNPGPDPPGTYYFVVNVYTSDGGACTGNWGGPGQTLFGTYLSPGWNDCGPGARLTVRLWDPVAFTGRVTRLGDGAPLPGVQVDACLDGWNCYRSAWADGAGYYTLWEPQPWVWSGYTYVYLTVRPPGGYLIWSWGPGTWPGWTTGDGRIVYPTWVQGCGCTYGANNFTLAWPVTFTGRVYNRTTGAGMGGVTVRLYLNGWSWWGETATDGAGNYSLTRYDWPPPYPWTFVDIVVAPPANWTAAQAGPGTSPGYVVSASAIRYPAWASGGTTYPNNNFGLDGVYAFSGRVTRLADGAGIPNVGVRMVREDTWATVAQAYTDATGSYSLGYQGYPTWNFILVVGPPPYHAAYSAASGSGGRPAGPDRIEFGAYLPPGSYGANNFVLKAWAAFSGRVSRRSDGAALAGATVQFWSGSSLLAGVTTDTGGNYAWTYDNWPPAGPLDIKVVPPAGYYAYQAQVSPPNGWGQVLSADTIRYPTTTPPGSYPGNNFILGGRITLSGRVYRYWDGKGVAGATVQLVINSSPAASALTGPDGSYMLSYDNWPPAAYADIVLVVPSGYLTYQAYANPPGQVVDARTIRYPGSAPPGSYPGNDFALTVPPPPPPSGSVSGGSCPQPCLVLMGGLLNPPSVGLSVTVDIPAGRDDIVRVELELDHTDPADGRTLTYSLPVSAGQTETVFTRASTGDPTFGEKALGSWTAKARLVSAAAGPGEWGAVGSYTVFWLPARITGP
jgi:hypothetical protein